MMSLKNGHRSSLYLRTAMVIITIFFGGIIFCGSNSNCHRTSADTFAGMEEIEFHQALPGRLFFYVSAFCVPAALMISPIINLLGPKSVRPNAAYSMVRPSLLIYRTITINAP
jgi:hypothetical protein